MSVMTRAEFVAGMERFKRACIANFNLKYAWPPSTEQQKAAYEEYQAALDYINNAELSDGTFAGGHKDAGDCNDPACICQQHARKA